MKKVVGLRLNLENMEQIVLREDEFRELGVDDILGMVVSCETGAVQTYTCSHIHFRMPASANHTYNSFGEPSELTIFNRLRAVDNPIAMVDLVYDDGSTLELCLPEQMHQICVVDLYGDLAVFCDVALADEGDEDEDVCEDCDCGRSCCCQDCEE